MTEVNQIIKEEFQRLVEKKKIQSRIQQINEELARMEEEDSELMGEETIEEVEAGSEMKVRSHAWTGEEGGDTKWTPDFEKKGTHLLEDEVEMEDEEMDDDSSLADEFAELGAAIEAKIMAALGKVGETEEEEGGEEMEGDVEEEDFEEVEVDGDETEEDAPIEESEEEEPIEEGEEESSETPSEEKESLNESTSRGNKKFLNVLSEGLDTRKKSALESEVERMRRLANLGGNND